MILGHLSAARIYRIDLCTDIPGIWVWDLAEMVIVSRTQNFRIHNNRGGASFYLSQKVEPEIVRIAGRRRSLAYEAYIRAFEQIASRHLGDLVPQPSP